jgi:FkbM family methyltransferase
MEQLESILETDRAGDLSLLWKFCQESKIVLYGAGLTGKTVLSKLRNHGISPLYFVDDTPSKQGTTIDGLTVISTTQLNEAAEEYALVVTMLNPDFNFHSLKTKLVNHGIKNVFSFLELSFLYPSDFLPYFHFDTKEKILEDPVAIRNAYMLFAEPLSRDLYLKNLYFRLNLDFEKIPVGDKDPYFPDSLFNVKGPAVFFDCGAYDGDTVKSFIERNREFDAAYAFEPDPENFNKLLNYAAFTDKAVSEKIFAYNFGLSSRHSYLKFNSLNNMASAISENGEGNVIIQTIDLDSVFLPLLKDYQGQVFIKMDIEGEEPNALIGCKLLMQQLNPHLAISIYHNYDDLWRIPLYIRSINPGYKFFLRQHGNDSMDLVLYAVAD